VKIQTVLRRYRLYLADSECAVWTVLFEKNVLKRGSGEGCGNSFGQYV